MDKARALLLQIPLLALIAGGCTSSETLSLDASMNTTTGTGGTTTGAGGQAGSTTTGTGGTTTGAGGSGGTVSGTGGSGGTGGGAGKGGSGGGGGSSVTDGGADRTQTGGSSGTDGGMVLSYMTDVAPIIANKCKTCHTTDMKAGQNWNYANLVTNSKVTNTTTVNCTFLDSSKRRVVPGMPDASLLWIKLSHTTDLKPAGCGDPMPEMTTLTTQEKDTIKNWITQGAKP